MNESVRRNLVSRCFLGFWRALNFTRRLAINLIFLCFIVIVVASVIAIKMASGNQSLDKRTTLVLNPEGQLVEQFSSDPISREFSKAMGQEDAAEVQLRDVIQVLESATHDRNIERVFVDIDKLMMSGYASLDEIINALRQFRNAGKQVIAFSEGLTQGQYALVAQANEVYLDPMGSVLLEGLSRYRQYYREALKDKLGVDVRLFRVGEYKSAAEPFILDGASEQAKEADLFWMNQIWRRMITQIAQARKLSGQQLEQAINQLPLQVKQADGDLAKLALQMKLVDGLKTREQVEELLKARGVVDPQAPGGFRQIDFENYLALQRSKHSPRHDQPQIAVVEAVGEIHGGEQPPGKIGGESTAQLLHQVREDKHIRAVIFRVNSPGGEVFASEQIRREIVALKQAGKPVVVSMGDYAASGGYWISMNADRIFAEPSTISGSIGIFGLVPNLARSLQKIGVHTDGVGTAHYAGATDITRPFDPQMGDLIQSVINKGYSDFTSRVAQARRQSVAAIDAIGRGRVWTGEQARERGLVDAIGGMNEALADAAARAKISVHGSLAESVVYVEKSRGPIAEWFGQFLRTQIGDWLMLQSGLVSRVMTTLPESKTQVWIAQSALAQAKNGHKPIESYAHCFCQLSL